MPEIYYHYKTIISYLKIFHRLRTKTIFIYLELLARHEMYFPTPRKNSLSQFYWTLENAFLKSENRRKNRQIA